MPTSPVINDEAKLLDLLRDAPTTRAVAYVRDDPAICDCETGDPARPSRVIAWVASGGSARALLDRAYDADCQADALNWSALPLRYGPYCSTWVLPEHPLAPSRPGAGE